MHTILFLELSGTINVVFVQSEVETGGGVYGLMYNFLPSSDDDHRLSPEGYMKTSRPLLTRQPRIFSDWVSRGSRHLICLQVDRC